MINLLVYHHFPPYDCHGVTMAKRRNPPFLENLCCSRSGRGGSSATACSVQIGIGTQSWLVALTILKNMKVNGKDYPIYYGKIKNVPNHQPVMVCHGLPHQKSDAQHAQRCLGQHFQHRLLPGPASSTQVCMIGPACETRASKSMNQTVTNRWHVRLSVRVHLLLPYYGSMLMHIAKLQQWQPT